MSIIEQFAKSGDVVSLRHYCNAENITNWAFLYAAARGHIDCLKLLYKYSCPTDIRLAQYAVRHIDCLKYVYEQGAPLLESASIEAADKGCIEALQFIKKNNAPYSIYLCTFAARSGHLECLKYTHEKMGCILDADVVSCAANGGHLGCLKYLAAKKYTQWRNAAIAAALGGSFKCLKLAKERGSIMNEKLFYKLFLGLEQKLNSEEAYKKCFDYAMEQNCPIDDAELKKAEILEWV